MVAGFYRGWLDTILMRFNDLVLSFPFLDLTFAKVSILRQTASSPGSFGLSATYNATDNGSFIAAGDINGDGYTDVIVNNPAAQMLQQTTAPGTFGAPTKLQ